MNLGSKVVNQTMDHGPQTLNKNIDLDSKEANPYLYLGPEKSDP